MSQPAKSPGPQPKGKPLDMWRKPVNRKPVRKPQ